MAVQILISNLAFTIPVLSTSTVAALQDDWTLGEDTCHFVAFCNEHLQTQRWLLTAVLVIDRALTISKPLKYEKHGAKVVAVLSLISLFVGLLAGIIPRIAVSECEEFSSFLNSCYFFSIMIPGCSTYTIIIVSALFLIGGVLPFILYLWMFCKARKANRQVVPSQHPRESTVTRRLATSRKQFLTVLLLFWTLLGCSLPHYLSFVFTYIFIEVGSFKLALIAAFSLIPTQFLYYGLVLADPIAIMWHKDVKDELHKLKTTIKTMLRELHTTHTTSTSVSG